MTDAATEIEATISVSIAFQFGTPAPDAKHVIHWLCADGFAFEGEYAGFSFEVCSQHADPEECDCRKTDGTYRATVTSADLES